MVSFPLTQSDETPGSQWMNMMESFAVGCGETLGQRLSRARTSNQWTLDFVARKIGVSKVSVWGWEKDRSRPRLESLESLSALFAMPLETLVSGGTTPSGGVPALIADCQTRIASAVGVQPDQVEIRVSFGRV
jgi:transcriptional regulator with XRE-family HTH domain